MRTRHCRLLEMAMEIQPDGFLTLHPRCDALDAVPESKGQVGGISASGNSFVWVLWEMLGYIICSI